MSRLAIWIPIIVINAFAIMFLSWYALLITIPFNMLMLNWSAKEKAEH